MMHCSLALCQNYTVVGAGFHDADKIHKLSLKSSPDQTSSC